MIRGKIKSISGTVPSSRTALRDHLYLGPDRAVKIGSLPYSVYSKFLNALDRSRNYAGSHAIGLSAAGARKVDDITNGVTGHIVGVLAPVNCECILVSNRTS